MAKRVGGELGGIVALLGLIDEHSLPLEYELIKLGLRLRECPSPAFNWRDLWVIVENMGRDSAVYKAIHPDDDTTWTNDTYLLANVVDALTAHLWQAGGGKGPRPKPLPRPGDTVTHRGDVMSMEEMREFLGWD